MVTTLMVQSLDLSEKDFCVISQMVYRHCGINLHAGKKELVQARLAKRLRKGNFKTFAEYMNHVLNDKTGKEFSILIDMLSTNLTGFFREPQHFEFLKNKFLPRLIDRKRKNNDFKIRCWSAGCSSGEEPYSIAITILDAIQIPGQWDVKILATDISTRMLAKAQKGIYDIGQIKNVPPVPRQKYLVKRCRTDGKLFEVGQSLRDAIIFSYLNLMKDWPIRGNLDFIFCRNVMIYFDKSTQQMLVNRFWDMLASGGVLFTGHSESLTGIKHKFNYVQPTIYIKP